MSDALTSAPIGLYQLQAAIAAVHDEASRAEDTDWPQILGLYGLLETIAPGPMVTLNRIVAVAMVEGPRAGLAQLASAEAEPALAEHHRTHAVRAHLEMAGDGSAAAAAYRRRPADAQYPGSPLSRKPGGTPPRRRPGRGGR